MTDYKNLVEGGSCTSGCGTQQYCMCALAEDMADEIERLREALHTIFCNTEPDAIKHRDCDHLAKNICEVARAALERKE